MSSVPSPASRTSSACGRSITAQTAWQRRTSSSPRWHSCCIVRSKRNSGAAARLDLSATEALTALNSVRMVDIALGDGTTKRSVTHGSQRAATVLRALGIELDPPTPPQRGETVM